MPESVMLGGLLEPGLRADAAYIYAPLYEGVRAQIGDVIWMEGTSDKFQEVFGFLEAPPYFAWWPAETAIPSDAMESQRFVIPNRDFGRRVNLPRNVEDDQTGTAQAFARMIARTYAILPEEIFYQILQAGAYNSTTRPFPSVPNAIDGNALYISTTRYGSTSGNVVTSTSTTTVQGIITDLMSCKRRFMDFQNTKSRPFWDPPMVNKLRVFYGTALTTVMSQAEFQTRVPWEQTSGANGTGQTPTNLLRENGIDIKYTGSQRITDSQYYVWLRELPPYLRPIWRQVRKNYTEWQGNFVTSDMARNTGVTYVQGDCREGWLPIFVGGTVRVT